MAKKLFAVIRKEESEMSENTQQEIQSADSSEATEAKPSDAADAAEPQTAPPETAPASAKDIETEAEVESAETVTLSVEAHQELEAQASKATENWDRLLRLQAEFDNFKKRTARDRCDAVKYANEAILESLIPVLDNFDMAMAAVDKARPDALDSLKQGIAMVFKQLREAIRESGMEEINATGQMFDPDWHEAVSQQETDETPEGHVTQQIRKGYKLRDRLIRPANVIVAKAKSAPERSTKDAGTPTED